MHLIFRGEGVVQKNSNFTDKKFMPLIGDLGYCDASLPNKNSSDNSFGYNNRYFIQDTVKQPGGNLLSLNEIMVIVIYYYFNLYFFRG